MSTAILLRDDPNPVLTRLSTTAGATTWDPAAQTFALVLASGAAVARHDSRGAYDEILAVEGMRAPTTVPLLDSHQRGSIGARLGSVAEIQVSGGTVIGKATLSRTNVLARNVAAGLDDGEHFAASVGYSVQLWAPDRQNAATGRRERVALEWTIVEASLVVLPADANAGVRGAGDHAGGGDLSDRAAINTAIRGIAAVSGLDQRWIDVQIDAGADLAAASTAALAALAGRSAAGGGIRTASLGRSGDDPEVRARAMGEALYSRVATSHVPSEPARAFVGLSIGELARLSLRSANISTTGMGVGTVIERALQSTSDFPLLLADTVNRTLRQAYAEAPAGVRALGRQTTARDFRTKHRIMFSSAPDLLPVNESGEFKSGGMTEAEESYAVSTFGRIIGFTRQAMINDDLGAFADVTRRMGLAAARFENNFLVDLLLASAGAGPIMADGFTLFGAAHRNLAAAASIIDSDSLSAARRAMRAQVGLNGELIGVTPKYLLVGGDRETEAEKALSAIQAVTTTEVNVFAQRLQLIVDPRLSQEWFVVADPAQIDGLEFAYLEGNAGPQITSQIGFEVDGVRFKVRLDFGGGFVDWRGWYRNAGLPVT